MKTTILKTLKPSIAILLATLFLTSCGESGEATVEQVDPVGNDNDNGLTYSGPPPQTDDIQNFKLYVWDKLAVQERCGQCHGTSGQVPSFVRTDDINEAYRAASPLINLTTPALSKLTEKVQGGHNCWLDSTTACGDIITGYITAWATSVGSISNEIILVAPVDQDVGSSKNFPSDPAAFAATVYPLLAEYCSACHAVDTALSQQPYIGSADVQVSYDYSRSRMRLDDPVKSRLVQRLGSEFHGCWSGNCTQDAATMTASIEAFVLQIPKTEVDPELVLSRALRIGDGIVASSGGRIEPNLIAKYEFKTGSGSTAYDTSGVEPAADLTLTGNIEWLNSWGLRVIDGKAQAATSTSRKLYDLISGTGEYTIETWVVPENVSQEGPAIMVSYSGSTEVRNFTLGQTLYNYDFLQRSSTTDGNGNPALSTADADERLQTTLQHAVVTFDPINGRKIYVNGEFTGDLDTVDIGNLNEWDSSYALVIGNEVSSDRQWKGNIRMLAIHNRALTPEDIATNYEVGVGEKYYLLFNISEWVDMSDAYVVFQVSQFDDYSYLFSEPFFTTLGDEAVTTFPMSGIRIGINGREVIVGQAYANIDLTVSAAEYIEGRQPISRLGTILGLEQGPEFDAFFLTFDLLGTSTYVRVEAEPPALPVPADIPDQPRLGIKTFAEINASLADMTGVNRTNSAVVATYQKVEQQLPSSSLMEGFVAAQQMGITQLAVSYCNVLVGGTGSNPVRTAFFPGFDFSQSTTGAFSTAGRTQIIEPLLQTLIAAEVSGSGLDTQANPNDLRLELNQLITKMTACGGNCASDRTYTVVKATCAAALGSAVMLIH